MSKPLKVASYELEVIAVYVRMKFFMYMNTLNYSKNSLFSRIDRISCDNEVQGTNLQEFSGKRKFDDRKTWDTNKTRIDFVTVSCNWCFTFYKGRKVHVDV